MTLKDLNATFIVSDQEYQSQLDEDLFINPNDLSSEYAKHSGRFAWYATCYELALDKLTRLEVDLKRAHAVIDHEKRGELAMAGVKSTEKMVENSVLTDDRYIILQQEVQEASRQVGVLKAARDAMIHRKDMLISLGATYRAEVKADISLLANEVKNR